MRGNASRGRAAPPPEEERALITGLREGDEASYERLLEAYGGRMLAVARRIVRNDDDAQDCVQEAFLQAFRNVARFEGRAALGSWLHRIVVNAALMRIRQRDWRQETPLEDSSLEFDANGMRKEAGQALVTQPEDLLESRETQALVRSAIDALPADFRNVLLLRDIEEYDTAEAAALLGLSLSATKTRLHRARAALKKRLEKRLEPDGPNKKNINFVDRT